MEKFLGVLFCGGKGTRLGEITKFISKSFIPIYDRPVFKYGLELLEKSKYIDEILILTNSENDEKFQQVGYKTLIQDDKIVFDMLSGWNYIKKVTNTKKHGVLMPSDNVSNVNVDALIELFIQSDVDIVFSLYEINNEKKLSEMGVYDINENKFYYKSSSKKSNYGVIAPYVVNNSLDTVIGDEIFNKSKKKYMFHNGYWFDIGDSKSLLNIYSFILQNLNINNISS